VAKNLTEWQRAVTAGRASDRFGTTVDVPAEDRARFQELYYKHGAIFILALVAENLWAGVANEISAGGLNSNGADSFHRAAGAVDAAMVAVSRA
jgi:hypothetical protein